MPSIAMKYDRVVSRQPWALLQLQQLQQQYTGRALSLLLPTETAGATDTGARVLVAACAMLQATLELRCKTAMITALLQHMASLETAGPCNNHTARGVQAALGAVVHEGQHSRRQAKPGQCCSQRKLQVPLTQAPES